MGHPLPYGPGMEQWLALVAFSFASVVTPGPNNVLLWASGASFGLRRTMPHVVGTAVGIGLMTVAVAAGSGALGTAIPGITVALKVGGSLYLLYLAFQIARMGAMERPGVAHPFGLVSASVFQLINPKAWVFALTAVSTFRSPTLPVLLGSAVVIGTMVAVIVPTEMLWAGAGDGLGKVASSRHGRAVSLGLAALLVASVALVWV